MYKYSDNNENNDIILHDCRADKLLIGEKSISFVFGEGFYVSEKNRNNYNKKLSYTDKSEVIFKTLYHTDADVTVYIFSETDKEDTAIRKSISAKQLAEMVNSGMKLEFLYSYKGYQSYIFECWLWSDTEPFHKECVIIISADDVLYNWNVLYAEE